MIRVLSVILVILLFSTDNLIADEIKTEAFVKASIYSPILERDWKYNVYLPKSYHKNSEKTYPVVYLLHGMYDNENTFKAKNVADIFNKLIEYREMPEVIVVTPDGFGYSWWVNSETYGNVEDAFIKDLIPQIEEKYAVSKSKYTRILAGISMGGYGALHYALRYPELFYSVGLLSPAVFHPLPGDEVFYSGSYPTDWRYSLVIRNTRGRGVFGAPFDPLYYLSLNYRRLYIKYKKTQNPLKFYIVYGTKDSITDNATKNLIAFFRRHNQPIEIMEVKNGGHDWGVWKKGLEFFLSEPIFTPTQSKR